MSELLKEFFITSAFVALSVNLAMGFLGFFYPILVTVICTLFSVLMGHFVINLLKKMKILRKEAFISK